MAFLGNIDALKAQHYWIDDYLAEIRFANVPKAIPRSGGARHPRSSERDQVLQAFADATGYPQGHRRPNATWPMETPEAVLERHMQYANVRGIRDFGAGRYLVDSAWRSGYKFLEAP